MEQEEASPEETKPEQKRFRWGCFFLATLIFLLLFILLLLLLWPVEKKAEVKKPKVSERSLAVGGARFEILSAEIIGAAPTYGPGDPYYFRMLVTARITNLTEVNQALDIYLMMVKQAKSVGQSMPSIKGTQNFYDSQEVESPWDQPLRPGQSEIVRAIFTVHKPIAGMQMFVRKGFDRNSKDYVVIDMPEVIQQAERKSSTTTTNPEEVRDVGEVMRLKRHTDLDKQNR